MALMVFIINPQKQAKKLQPLTPFKTHFSPISVQNI